MKSCFVNKLTTLTKMNYLGGVVIERGWSKKMGSGAHAS
jgi:hypothetical protein